MVITLNFREILYFFPKKHKAILGRVLRRAARWTGLAGLGLALSGSLTPPSLGAQPGAGPALMEAKSMERLLFFMHKDTGFATLGLMLVQGDPQSRTIMEAAAAAARSAGFDLAPPFDLPAEPGPEDCREALDSLYFDAVDAVLLARACFPPERPENGELLRLLAERGNKALCFSPGLVKEGALLSPSTEELRRMDLAWQARGKAGQQQETDYYASPPGWSLNLAASAVQGFNPAPGALLRVETFFTSLPER